jgi:transcriptional regulator with XRE-family HTH domain
MPQSFGAFFAELRGRAGYGLRQFSSKLQIDPGNLSKMERDKLLPPSRDRLEVYARALGLDPGAGDWVRLFDLASVARGEIPRDLLDDQKLAMQLLGVFEDLRSRDGTDSLTTHPRAR